jgi:acetyl-CoA carboxylase biotin carboxylase subunit
MGHKTRARELAAQLGWPVGPASDVLPADTPAVLAAAESVGYPVLVKPAGGGGGIGMMVARDPSELPAAVERAASMASRGFANPEVYLERLVERDCSVQRRHQKLIEEARAPRPPSSLMPLMQQVASALATLGYDNLGTVELLLAPDGEFRFLEMNTRLQVEHGVTEEITGIDIVAAQFRSAAGERLASILPPSVQAGGHAIQARVYAEDPKRFLPSPGLLREFSPPIGEGIRIETGYAQGREVTPHYDPLLAKVIVRAGSRAEAIDLLVSALREFRIEGVRHNIPALVALLDSVAFREGSVHTGLVTEVLGVNGSRLVV